MATSVSSLMLVLNIMISLEFEKGDLLPSITLTELGNMEMAQSETSKTLQREPAVLQFWKMWIALERMTYGIPMLSRDKA